MLVKQGEFQEQINEHVQAIYNMYNTLNYAQHTHTKEIMNMGI